MEAQSQNIDGKRRRAMSVSTRLILALNLTVVVVLGSFLVWDYTMQWDDVVQRTRAALDEEALAIAELLVPHRDNFPLIQTHVDRICARVQEAQSPGHHVAVRTPDGILQSSAHHRPSPEMYEAMRRAAESVDGTARTDHGEIVVGAGTAPAIIVYVSKYLSSVRRDMRAYLVRRVGAVTAFSAILGLLVSWLAHRLITRPLLSVVDAVQRLHSGELGVRAKAGRSAEFVFLADEFNRMSAALREADEQRHQAMDRARNIQRHILPRVEELRNVKACAIYRPADEVAGDYYDVFTPKDGSVLFCIADVSGHGVPAAMGAAMLKALTQTRAEQESDLGELLDRVNRAYSGVSLPDEFATMFLALFDPASMTLRYAGAGHEPAYLLRRAGDTETLESTGLPLGVAEDGPVWDTRETRVEAGDRIVFLTDGIVESKNARGDVFGRDRLRDLLQAGRGGELDHLADTVRRAVDSHCGGTPRGDDITLLFAELLDIPESAAPVGSPSRQRREEP